MKKSIAWSVYSVVEVLFAVRLKTLELRDKLSGWRSHGGSGYLMESFQTLEFQMIWWECRFD